jgi:phage baseplate assembly protein W
MPQIFNWPLQPDQVVTPPGGSSAASTQAAANAQKGLPSFLGQGLLRPFQRDQKSDFASAAGLALIKAEIGQILGTKCDNARGPGELAWRTDFGSRLHLLRHHNHKESLDTFATVLVQEALAKWMPLVSVIVVEVTPTVNQRVLQLRVRFNVVDQGGKTVLPDQTATVDVKN